MNKNSIKIIPAVMPRNLADLEEKVHAVVGAVPVVQIDIMDGEFVPNNTWPYLAGKRDAEEEVVESVFTRARFADDFKAIVREESGLPFWDEIDYELDLMIADADKTADLWIATGARRLIFHIESLPADRMLAMLQRLRTRFPRPEVKKTGGESVADQSASDKSDVADHHESLLEIGMALNVHTAPEKVERFIEQIDFVQCMGIEKIGYQGEQLAGGVLDQIRTLREEYPWLPVTVDGGITERNASILGMEGVSRVVCGSAVFDNPNPAMAVRQIQECFTDGHGDHTESKIL